MEDDRKTVARQIADPVERHVHCTGNALASIFIGTANVDQACTGIDRGAGVGGERVASVMASILAIELVEGGEQRFDAGVRNGVPKSLALSPESDEAFVASSVVATVIVLLVSPAAKLTVPVAAVKSLPEVAVPLAVA